MLGPQVEHFQPESVRAFLDSDYLVTPQMDRMGMRLQGTQLAHVTPAAADIVSDGVTPGAIQVPGNGQPIILLADCQTVGGYPKIATVISADLPRLGQLRPGHSVRFSALSAAEARQALLAREAQWQMWVDGIAAQAPGAKSLYDDLTDNWISANW
jgi:allophanate hydrolase